MDSRVIYKEDKREPLKEVGRFGWVKSRVLLVKILQRVSIYLHIFRTVGNLNILLILGIVSVINRDSYVICNVSIY